MPSFEELADGYAAQLRAHADVASVALDINGLVYTKSQANLTTADKLVIAGLIQERLVAPTTRTDSQGRTWILKEADNKRYLQLVGALKGLLK